MDEQRIQEYVQLIKQLLRCLNGEELAILEANTNLLNAELLTVMATYSQWLRQQGQDNAAQWLEQFAQKLQPYILGTASSENSDTWEAINQQVIALYQQGNYGAAIPLAQKAVELARQRWGNQHSNVAATLNNLASLYESQGKYAEAEPLFNEAIAIVRIALPENHPDLATHLNNLAGLYRSQGKYSEAFEQFQASLESENLRLRYIFSTSSDRERREYLQKNLETYYAFLTLVWQHLRDDPQAVGAALDAVLGRKALSTAALAAQNAAIYSGRYSEAIQNIFRDLQQCNEEILEATYAPPPKPELSPEAYEQQRKKRRQRLADLQKESEELEKQLAKEIPELQLSHQKVNRDLVAAQLPDGSALVEFVRFKRYDFGATEEQWQEDRYLAFVVMAHQPETVRLVDLGEAEPLDKLIKAFRSQFVSKEDDMGMTGSSASVPAAPSPTEQLYHALYHVLCQPLITALPSGCHCFLAPDSTLNLLPFQILPLSQNKNNDVDYSAFQFTEPQTQYVCRGDSRIAPTDGLLRLTRLRRRVFYSFLTSVCLWFFL